MHTLVVGIQLIDRIVLGICAAFDAVCSMESIQIVVGDSYDHH